MYDTIYMLHLCLSLPSGSFLQGFPIKMLHIVLFYACYIPHHLILCGFIVPVLFA
jgi:hypothetical protein